MRPLVVVRQLYVGENYLSLKQFLRLFSRQAHSVNLIPRSGLIDYSLHFDFYPSMVIDTTFIHDHV